MALKPENITAIRDTREQRPWTLHPLQVIPGTLDVADYSLSGLTDHVRLERKELGDLVACTTRERQRFERELRALRGFSHRAVIVEAAWSDLESGTYRSRATPQSVTASVLSWMGRYAVPFLFAGGREAADRAAARWLYLAARDFHRISTATEGGEVGAE